LDQQDAGLLRRLRGKKKVIVLNKSDLRSKIQKRALERFKDPVVSISAKRMMNITALENTLIACVSGGEAWEGESAIIGNMRQAQGIARACDGLRHADKIFAKHLSAELCADAVKTALQPLDELLGREFSNDMLDKIFKDFCVGK
jgi:tRNA modification GTPase